MKKALWIALLSISAPLTAQPREELNRAPWYEPPQLFVMTGFIANTTTGVWGADFITEGQWTPEKQQAVLREWNRGLGSEYDAERWVREFKEAGATGMIFYSKWHDGIVAYPTKFTKFMTERDLMGPTLEALEKHGMHKVVYYSVGLDYNPEPRFDEWTTRSAEGEPLGLAFPTDWMSFHSPYRQFVIDQLTEIVRDHGPIQGLWLDLYTQPSPVNRRIPGRVSHDKFSQAKLLEALGKKASEATDEELQKFVEKTFEDFLWEIRSEVAKVQPGVSYTWNSAGMGDSFLPRKAKNVDGAMDWFSMEGHHWENIDRGARLGHATDRPFEVGMLLNSSWYVPMSEQAPPAAMSEAEAIVSAATAWIQGANVYAAMTPGHSGVYDVNGDVRLLRAIGGWLKDNKAALMDATPFADIGIVVGSPSSEITAIPSVTELWKASHGWRPVEVSPRAGIDLGRALRGGGYLTERVGGQFASKEFKLSDYRLLVLPENALLDDDLEERIRQYVRGGGNLLAFGHASLFNSEGQIQSEFGLNDVFGVSFIGPLPGYKQFQPEPDSGLLATLPLNPGALKVEPGTATPLAVWRSAGNSPAVVENQFGRGKSIYVTAEEIPFGGGVPLLHELVARLIGENAVEVDARRDYYILMNQKEEHYYVYLLNRSTGSRSAYRTIDPAKMRFGDGRASVDTAGSEEVLLTLDTGILGAIESASVYPGGRRLPASRQKGKTRILVDASPGVTTIELRKQ